MLKREKNRLVLVALLLAASCLTVFAAKDPESGMEFTGWGDLPRIIARRAEVPTADITLDARCEKGEFLFAAYHIVGEERPRLVHYRTRWRRAPLRRYKSREYLGESSRSGELDFAVSAYGDMTILVAWGDTAENGATGVTFRADGAVVERRLPYRRCFIEPFVYIDGSDAPFDVQYLTEKA